MLIYLVLVIFAALLQTTVVSLNLCLVTLIAVAFIRRDGLDLYVGFIGGLILGLLSGVNVGFYPIIFLIILEAIYFYKKLPISGNAFFSLPAIIGSLLFLDLSQQIILNQSPNFYSLPIETLLFLLIFFLVQFFEDRVNQAYDTRLRLK